MRLADVAPRLALARDQWIAAQERRERVLERVRVRREREEVAADGHRKCADTGKLRYRTQQSAEHALAHLIVHTKWQRPCRAYRCKHCDGWHLTSQPRRQSYGRAA